MRVAFDQPFRERGAASTHNHHGPDLVSIHIHIFTTPAVRVQHEVTVHVTVKTSAQLGHAVAHLEWVCTPGNEQALRIHVDRLLRQQQHLSFLRAKPPIASSIPLRTAPLLLGGNASDPVAQAHGACPSRGKFTRRTARHGLSDDPRANVSSVGPCTEDPSDQLLASVEAACDPRDRDRVTDMVTLIRQAELVSAFPALSQATMQTCTHVSN